jgi:subtilisin family serine protease
MDLGSIQVQSGELKTFRTSLSELSKYFGLGDDWSVVTRFSVLGETNLNIMLSQLSADYDIYIGEINPETNSPYFDVDDDTATVLNSSTNPGDAPENLFARLPSGEYWLKIKPQGWFDKEVLDAEFEFSLDGKTFDDTTVLSNDLLLDKQWHLFNTGIVNNWKDEHGGQWLAAPNVDIGAPEAWKLAVNADLPIAIIDSGVDVDHPDLINNLWINPGEIPGNGEDDDGNGKKDDIHGWNFVKDSPVMDVEKHGTHVAGIAGAQGNNQIGVSGVAWDTQLMVLDVFGGENRADDKNISNAIYYAVDNGAKVINMSLGGNNKVDPQFYLENVDAYKKAFQYAYENDVFIAIASGNEGGEWDDRNKWDSVGNFDLYASSPAVFSQLFGNIASVGSSNAQNFKSSYSNYGQSISISAPGGDGGSVMVSEDEFGFKQYVSTPETLILSTVPVGTGTVGDGNYGYTAGTSMASPVIAGMAGLIRAQNASISAPETLAILRAGAVQNSRLNSGVNQNYQANLYYSLQLAQNWQGPDSITGIGQEIAPVLNLSSLTTAQRLTGSLNLSGQVAGDSLIGFYQVLDTEGTVIDALGNAVKPGDANYQSVALNSGNLVDGLNGLNLDGNSSLTREYALSGSTSGVYLAPYVVSGADAWFAWNEANADGIDRFMVLGPNQFGFAAMPGSSGGDFTDVVMSFSSDQIL